MSVHILNNNAVTSLVSDVYQQMIGGDDIDTVDLSKLVDIGKDANILDSKEAFTKTLANVIYNRLYTTDHIFDPVESDPFYVNANEWGAILSAVSVETPDTIIANRAWTDYTSGVSTVGTSTVYLPAISELLFGGSVSWSIPVSITKEMWQTAFLNAEGLSRLVNAVYVACRNGVTEHRLAMDRANRNNFIGELIHYAGTVSATGVHVIDLNTLYNAWIGNDSESMTREEFLNKPEAMIFAAKTLDEYIGYMEEPNVLFNLDGKDKFVDRGEVVVQVLAKFENQLEYAVKSDVYHNNIVKLPNHRKVNSWQGFGEGLTFDELSAIKVKTANGDTVAADGIVAFCADRYAIMHTIVHENTVTEYYKFNDLTHTEFQFVDRYSNNLGMPALVFVIDDFTVESGGGEG